jgi:predicted GNAT superfamily acetyltransferase
MPGQMQRKVVASVDAGGTMANVEVAEEAVRAADAAARAAHVTIRELHDLAELRSVGQLYDEIWRPDDAAPISTELLRAFAKSGNYVVGAFDTDSEAHKLVGACVGFFAAPAQATLHSHIAGVSAQVLGRSVGYALKLHQRSWALLRGAASIEWTFDPLVSRNAYFNLVKLGARPVEYLPNFYGGLHDGINVDDETDRLLVRWNLVAPDVSAACLGQREAALVRDETERGAVVALDRTDDGTPAVGRLDAELSLVAAPRDIEAVRISDPDKAKQWRVAMRTVLGGLMAAGGHVTGFDRDGWYVVRHEH